MEYVLYADEGHGFARPCNRIDFYQARARAYRPPPAPAPPAPPRPR